MLDAAVIYIIHIYRRQKEFKAITIVRIIYECDREVYGDTCVW
jgi:hypothetical protein